MTLDQYIAAMNQRIRISRERKDEQARETAEAKNSALDAAADYMRDLASVMQVEV